MYFSNFEGRSSGSVFSAMSRMRAGCPVISYKHHITIFTNKRPPIRYLRPSLFTTTSFFANYLRHQSNTSTMFQRAWGGP